MSGKSAVFDATINLSVESLAECAKYLENFKITLNQRGHFITNTKLHNGECNIRIVGFLELKPSTEDKM